MLPWPGNIRELANVMRRAAVLCSEDTIQPTHLGDALRSEPAEVPAPAPPETAASSPDGSAESFWELYGKEEFLEKMSPGDLNQMLHSLHGLEASVLAALRKKGMGPPAKPGLRETEVEMIRKSLEQHRWNITETARALGIARNTLHRKIKKLNLRHS